LKRLIIPLITAAVLGLAVVGVGVGLAQQEDGTVNTFLAKVAAKLGISEEKLTTAVDEAYDETLDEAVSSGRLTQEQADRLKERGFDFAPQFGRGPGFGERGPMQGVQLMDAAAEALGMSADDLMAELKDGKSLADVAEAKGISVEKLTSDLLGQVKAQLDGLVSDGKLTQEQADNIYVQTESNIDQIVSDTSGLGGPCGPRGGRGFGPMPGSSDSSTPGGMAQTGMGL
jgi:polyhydroxyalkanoate synthesis regulator phasin